MLRLIAISLTSLACALTPLQDAEPTELTLQGIMADPVWMGRFPTGAYWSPDSKTVYYNRKNPDDEQLDLHSIEVASRRERLVQLWVRGSAPTAGAVYDSKRERVLTVREGDLFLTEVETGADRQLTRTEARESSPQFLLEDQRISFRRDRTLFLRDLVTGLESEAAPLRFEEDPAKKLNEPDHLEEQQVRLFQSLQERKKRQVAARDRERESRELDPTRVPVPWYLPPDKRQAGFTLSPNGAQLFLRISDDTPSASKTDEMPKFVTDSSWVEHVDVRAHVGFANSWAEELLILDLETRECLELDLSVLPGIFDKSQPWRASEETESSEDPTPKSVHVIENRWSPDGTQLAFMLRSLDNKDRWLARFDFASGAVVPIHHLHDEAWIGWRFNELGWLPDSSALWFTSEETGYSQLYLWSAREDSVHPLTTGEYEIDKVELNPTGDALYFRSNQKDPGIHEVARFTLPDGPLELLTDLGGRTEGKLSPDGKTLLLTHSTALSPPELYLQEARPGAVAERLTHSTTSDFESHDWIEPQFIRIPSSTGGGLHARLYEPREPSEEPRPVVAFVHGAGYLQNAHRGWSSYFREFMFHSFLVQEGYIVIDVDYRASAGYGRDWRTAIYRRMGQPELEDYLEALDWLANNRNIDADRIGIYGGSYGGFLTLMALFNQPGLYACGAALRPVTDWSHYNHGYTSNILNTPQDDPEAYRVSSPIENAEDLQEPLLICHGMLDSNVLVKDSIRLAQLLIELEKENFELALYPVEGHAFSEASSWLDEYRRIFKLFETHLK